jgi:subtilisin family serine protease
VCCCAIPARTLPPASHAGSRSARLPPAPSGSPRSRYYAAAVGGNFARSNIAVIGLQEDSIYRDPDALVGRLAARGEVENAGALVQLSDEHASFLTDTVIARFAVGVDDAAVAQIAARHELTPVGRFGDLGNVHRLRFRGPATYAVLDTSNRLADEPEVLWAEPDLVHTVELDAVSPTDFLFPAQWDYPIINLPDAWQFLESANPDRTFGSPNIIIAVVDPTGGIEVTHPDFSGTVSNGQPKVYQQFDFAHMQANMNNLLDDHGTCCASAATAQANNPSTVADVNEGVAGVAGNCRLLAIATGGPESRFAEMYLWAAGFDANSSTAGFPAQITPGADVITSSFGLGVGSPISGLMSMTFDRLTDDGRRGRGVLLFFAAGDADTAAGRLSADLDLSFARPWAMYDRCFCVAASTLANDGVTEAKAKYSSYGSTVDFCAPSSSEGQMFVLHNTPTDFGAHTATGGPVLLIETGQDMRALPGHPDRLTNLTTAAAEGDGTVTVGTVAGLAADQAILIGTPGVAGTEGRRIMFVNAAANQVNVIPPLNNAHPVGTAVAAGPFSHTSGFAGTSYATPVCAGVGALMLSVNPELRWYQVGDILRTTAIKIDPDNTQTSSHSQLAAGRWRDGDGRISTDPGYTGPLVSEFYGFGRIDAAAAVRRASGWSKRADNVPEWSDALGWDDVANYSTMRLAVANNDLYLLARGGAGGAVDGGLGQAPADDHAAGQAGAEVGRAHAKQLAVGVDLMMLAGRVGFGRAKALGEADQQDPDRGRRELEVLDHGHVGQPEGGQARLDPADDGRAVAVQVEQLDDDDPEHDQTGPGRRLPRGRRKQPDDGGPDRRLAMSATEGVAV